jgi:hypothetical protein
MNRNNCVLCDSTLNKITTVKNCKFLCLDNPDINNVWDMKIGSCEKCYSVQLMTLMDPNILYGPTYFQPLNNSYIWVQHNISFTNFIVKNLPFSPIIEIGSSSFCLGKHLIHYYKDYTVFDYCVNCEKRPDVKYLEGNCENYDFPENSNIVMSHVFEHLYEPKKFITNCKKNKVKKILISIPKMINNNYCVNEQHTFLYNENDIEHIFSLYDYKLIKHDSFISSDNSFECLFFYFELSSIVPIPQIIIKNRDEYSIKFLNEKIIIPKKSCIGPAGMWLCFLLNKIENIHDIDFIVDINEKKQNKYYGNTNIMISNYDKLKNYNHVTIFNSTINNIVETINNSNDQINICIL